MPCLRLFSLLTLAACTLATSLPASSDEPAVARAEAGLVNVQLEDTPVFIRDHATVSSIRWTAVAEQFPQVEPVSDLLRQHLKIPAGQGLVLMQQIPASEPADEAALKPGDILLQINETPVSELDTLLGLARGSEGQPVQLKLMRHGTTLQIGVPQTIFFSPPAKRYRIGISMDAADDTLRAQLGLDEGVGLVVTEVLEEWPARAAGIKQHDVLLIAGGTKLTDTDSLVEAVQTSGGKPMAVTLIRAGEQLVMSVTPKEETEPEPVKIGLTFQTFDLESAPLFRPYKAVNRLNLNEPFNEPFFVYEEADPQATGAQASTRLDKRLSQVLGQLESLHEAVEQLRRELKSANQDTAEDGGSDDESP